LGDPPFEKGERVKRSLITAAAVLLLAVLGLAATATTSSAGGHINPAVGHYKGIDAHGRQITFYYDSHNQMTNFTVTTLHHGHPVARLVIGGAHVSHHNGSMWHRTCHGGKCTSGAWVNDVQVHGTWDSGNAAHHTPFHASFQHVGGAHSLF